MPPAKFSVIAEYVWLLEKTNARRKFLAFGNSRLVPTLWLKKCGHLAAQVEFWFLNNDFEMLTVAVSPEGRAISTWGHTLAK